MILCQFTKNLGVNTKSDKGIRGYCEGKTKIEEVLSDFFRKRKKDNINNNEEFDPGSG